MESEGAGGDGNNIGGVNSGPGNGDGDFDESFDYRFRGFRYVIKNNFWRHFVFLLIFSV